MTTNNPTSESALQGLTVLLVEDNFLNGISLQQTLQHLGCDVIGPIASVSRGLELAAKTEIDVGVLDINIIGGTVEPIAEKLRRAQRKFIFVTGYGSPQNLPEPLKKFPRLRKPVDKKELEQALREMVLGPPKPSGDLPN